MPPSLDSHQRRRFLRDLQNYDREDAFLFQRSLDNIYRRCIPEDESENVNNMCHSSPCDGHMGVAKTATKMLESGLWWPTLFRDM